MEKVKLKPCPFCGSEFLERGNHTVYCQECNAGGSNSQSKNGVETWNRRPIEDALVEALYAYTKPDGCGPGCEDGNLCRMCQGEAALAKARGVA